MNLYNKLPTEDKQLIKKYLIQYTNVDDIPHLDKTLQEWSKNKKTLYKALGNQFRIKVPIDVSMNKNFILLNKLNDKYTMPTKYYYYHSNSTNKKGNEHPFISKLLDYFKVLASDEQFFSDDLYDISLVLKEILNWKTLIQGHVNYFSCNEIQYKNKRIKCNRGVKPLRILRKILGLIDFPYMDIFEKFCDDISLELTNVNNNKNINLVFSIHPIDFMTMSHNTCNWSSCMNWNDGCYSNGVLEMMNSNMVVVSYIESSNQDFVIDKYNIPNKSWRCLYYVHKDILCSGKSYPYYNETMIREGLKALAEIVKKNLNWNYQYKNQKYYDMMNFSSNESARNYSEYSLHHRIILYNYVAMYNDFAHDHDEEYWCFRNWVPKTLKLCASGPATCIICGEPITPIKEIRENSYYCDEDYLANGSDKCCDNCNKKYYIAWNNQYYLITPTYTINTLTGYFCGSDNTIFTIREMEVSKDFIMERFSILKGQPSENFLKILNRNKITYYNDNSNPLVIYNDWSSSLFKCLIYEHILNTREEFKEYFKPIEEEDIERILSSSNSISL